MLGVKYCRRPAMAEVVSTTKYKITECLMLSGREAAFWLCWSDWRLSVSGCLLLCWECLCALAVSTLLCPLSCASTLLQCVHSRGRDLDCSRASTTLLMVETRWRNHPELQNALLLTFTYTKEKNIRIWYGWFSKRIKIVFLFWESSWLIP